jgi:glycosyltransferase involved in cell wall biosynthesis
MKKALIIVDNLRIGGIQRLTLDQAYGLSELGIQTTIYILDGLPSSSEPTFVQTEASMIDKFKINLLGSRKSRIKHIWFLRSLLKEQGKLEVVLSHSLKGTVLLFLVEKITGKKCHVITTIHQLPTLSAPIQRFRRFIYAQTTWRLLAYSEAVRLDWNQRVSRNFFSRIILGRKKIDFLRNGIYLNRLPARDGTIHPNLKPRLIYLGRNTAWKGVNTFLDISNFQTLENFDILFMIPSKSDLDLSSFDVAFQKRITVVEGKAIDSLVPRFGDVHIYPANYGPESRFVESVSLNCLEMACLGIPTLLTKNGLGSWIDLTKTNIFHQVDWTNHLDVAHTILEVSQHIFTSSEIEFLRSKITIMRQLDALIAMNDLSAISIEN